MNKHRATQPSPRGSGIYGNGFNIVLSLRHLDVHCNVRALARENFELAPLHGPKAVPINFGSPVVKALNTVVGVFIILETLPCSSQLEIWCRLLELLPSANAMKQCVAVLTAAERVPYWSRHSLTQRKLSWHASKQDVADTPSATNDWHGATLWVSLLWIQFDIRNTSRVPRMSK
jgi:hypothetical protein